MVAGLLAAAVAVGVGQLVAGVVAPDSSPVVAVGEASIDLTPPPVKDFAISAFGTNDKLVLVTGILAVLAVFAAIVGALAVRRLWYGMAGLAGFTAIGLAAALTRPTAGPATRWPRWPGAPPRPSPSRCWSGPPRAPFRPPGPPSWPGATKSLPSRRGFPGTAAGGPDAAGCRRAGSAPAARSPHRPRSAGDSWSPGPSRPERRPWRTWAAVTSPRAPASRRRRRRCASRGPRTPLPRSRPGATCGYPA